MAVFAVDAVSFAGSFDSCFAAFGERGNHDGSVGVLGGGDGGAAFGVGVVSFRVGLSVADDNG